MYLYKFAGIPVEIKNPNDLFLKKSRDYALPEGSSEKPEFSIEVTEDDLEYEKDHVKRNGYYARKEQYFNAIYRLFCEKAIYQDRMLCHGSVVEKNGRAFMFSAPSGTGKSTHVRLWKEVFGDEVTIINDDKPILEFRDDGIYIWGTPWNGKHNISVNKCVKLEAVCFLFRGEKNQIRTANAERAMTPLFMQTYRPRDKEGMIRTMDLMDRLLKEIPMYFLSCNISREAVYVAEAKMNPDTNKRGGVR